MNKENMTALVRKAQQDDAKALQELMNEFYGQLYYYTFKYVQDADLAGDITQETCISIMTDLKKLRQPEAFTAWAYQIVENKVKLHRRKTVREAPMPEDEDGNTPLDTLEDTSASALPEQVYEDLEFQDTMQALLNNLPVEQRMALLLYYYEEMPVKEIAAVQGTTEGTVKSRLNYGRKAVKQQVEDYEKKTGVRLHSITPLPLLLAWLFGKNAAETAVPAAIPVVAAAGAAGTATAVTAAKAAGSLAARKLIGIVLAATVTVGAVGGVIAVTLRNKDDNQGDERPDASTSLQGGETEPSQENEPTVPADLSDSEGLAFSEALNENAEIHAYVVVGMGTCTDTTLVIPESHEGLPVTSIWEGAFAESNVEAVYLPDTLRYLGTEAFLDCKNLKEVHLNNGLTFIGDRVFQGCTALTSVEIPDSVTTMETHVFRGCTALETAKLPSGLTELKFGLFQECPSLKQVNIPAGVSVLRGQVFVECASLTSLVLPDGLIEIGDTVFLGCTNLAEINFPEGLESIGASAFGKCTSLTTVSLPASLTEIHRFTFSTTANLTDIYLNNTMSSWKIMTHNYTSPNAGNIVVHCTDGDIIW